MNFLVPAAASAFLSGGLDWAGDTWRNVLVDGQVTETQARTFTVIGDIPPAAVISDIALTATSIVAGSARSAGVDHGTLVAQVTRTIYRHWIYHSTGLLVAHYDTSMFGPIARTIDGTTPVIVIPHPTGWFRFSNL